MPQLLSCIPTTLLQKRKQNDKPIPASELKLDDDASCHFKKKALETVIGAGQMSDLISMISEPLQQMKRMSFRDVFFQLLNDVKQEPESSQG